MLFPTLALAAGLAAAAPTSLQHQKRDIPANVPSFVVDYAPIVYLYSQESYFPADLQAQLDNTQPAINLTLTDLYPSPLTLDNLISVNSIPDTEQGRNIYLTSREDPTTSPRPEYLYGVKPAADGETEGARSCAIVVHKNETLGVVDVYYFYFYAFDFGGVYFGLNVGNHVGDWEHNMIRFNATTSLPISIWYSQHSGGQAFTYTATSKYQPANSSSPGIRPITYSANGTHANYATPGTHDHTIPGLNLPAGPIEDHTDAGYLWDPTLSAYYYTYDPTIEGSYNQFVAFDESTPVNYLYYRGKWGDDKYPENDTRQSCAFGIDALCEYTGGPTGPIDKDLVRQNVCPDSQDNCNVLPFLVQKRQEFEVYQGGARVL